MPSQGTCATPYSRPIFGYQMIDGEPLQQLFAELFEALKSLDYAWVPVQPERLLRYRKQPEAFSALVRYFGLGLDVSGEELESEGLSRSLFERLKPLRPAVSRRGDLFIPHTHWPPSPDGKTSYIYLGEESFELVRMIEPHFETFVGKNVLDLGSGAGGLSFEVASLVRRVVGLEASARAAVWSQAAARAQGMSHLSFHSAPIGTPAADEVVQGVSWDIAVSNPPMVVPTENDFRPHRDGGALGIEVPFCFLDFAARRLKNNGEVFMLCTNPVVRGRSAFFDRLDNRVWEVLEKRCLNDRFNQSLYRKERYSERGIQTVELYFLRLLLKKRADRGD